MYMKYLYTQITRPIPQLASRWWWRGEGKRTRNRSRFVLNPSADLQRRRDAELRNETFSWEGSTGGGVDYPDGGGEDTFESWARFLARRTRQEIAMRAVASEWSAMATAAFLIAIPKRPCLHRQFPHPSSSPSRPFSSRAPSHTSSDNWMPFRIRTRDHDGAFRSRLSIPKYPRHPHAWFHNPRVFSNANAGECVELIMNERNHLDNVAPVLFSFACACRCCAVMGVC